MSLDLSRLQRYASVFVSTHEGDAVLSCAARLIADGARGGQTLIVTLFRVGDEQPSSEPGSLSIGLPSAPLRDPACYASFRSVVFGRSERDEACLAESARLIEEILRRTEARSLYLPLGVGGHIDRRVAHEAALRVPPKPGRNVFFYEERPEALVPGAVRMRLAELGARLPPAAVSVAREGSLPRFLYRYNTVPQRRVAPGGWSERLVCTRLAARAWLQARAWQPQRAFGPRLQPVLQPVQGDSLAAIREMVHAEGERRRAPAASAHRLLAFASDYARCLGGRDHLERYWLLLPARDDEGRISLPAA